MSPTPVFNQQKKNEDSETKKKKEVNLVISHAPSADNSNLSADGDDSFVSAEMDSAMPSPFSEVRQAMKSEEEEEESTEPFEVYVSSSSLTSYFLLTSFPHLFADPVPLCVCVCARAPRPDLPEQRAPARLVTAGRRREQQRHAGDRGRRGVLRAAVPRHQLAVVRVGIRLGQHER